MKIVISATELKVITSKIEEAKDLIPGMDTKDLLKGLNITWTEVISSIALGTPLTIEISEEDLSNFLEMYGDLALDSIGPITVLMRNTQRLTKKMIEYKPTEAPVTVWFGSRIITTVKKVFAPKED
jgi:hypothetical protein